MLNTGISELSMQPGSNDCNPQLQHTTTMIIITVIKTNIQHMATVMRDCVTVMKCELTVDDDNVHATPRVLLLLRHQATQTTHSPLHLSSLGCICPHCCIYHHCCICPHCCIYHHCCSVLHVPSLLHLSSLLQCAACAITAASVITAAVCCMCHHCCICPALQLRRTT